MKALVTGATGFIGSYLTHGLVKEGWSVHVLKRPTSALQRIEGVVDSLQMHDIDDHGFDGLWDSIGPVDVVYHLATAYGRDGQTDAEVNATNVTMPQRLLAAAGAERAPLCITTDTCFPVSYPYLRAYTQSKRDFSDWGRTWAAEQGGCFVNLVLQHPFGPGDGHGKFVPWLIEQCLGNVDQIELTSGKQQKDFVYVADVVDALKVVAASSAKLPAGFSQFACGTGTSRSVRSFVELIHAATGSTSALRFGALPDRAGEPTVSCANVMELAKVGWSCKTSIEEGVRLTIEWHRANRSS